MKKSQHRKKTTTGKIVLLQGSFDIINWGHAKAFERAKSYGDYLIIALNTNRLFHSRKGMPVLPEYQKKFILQSFRHIDKVIMIDEAIPLKILKKYKVDVYCLTREHKEGCKEAMDYMKSIGKRVVFLPRKWKHKGKVRCPISTFQIKKRLLSGYMER